MAQSPIAQVTTPIYPCGITKTQLLILILGVYMAGSSSGNSTVKAADGQAQKTQIFAFLAMTCLFFFWGFITVLNDILIPFLKDSFDLNYTQAMLVQFCFFGAYFIVSPFAGNVLIDKVGLSAWVLWLVC